jgi:hypothetical protein
MRLGFLFLLSLSGFYLFDVWVVSRLRTHGVQLAVADLPISFPALTAIYLWSCADVLVVGRLLHWISSSPRFKSKSGFRA